MELFSVEIDCTALSFAGFNLIGAPASAFAPGADKGGWVDGRTIQTASLEPGSYTMQFASAQPSFNFDVTNSGLIFFDPKYASCLSGKDTNRLTVSGFEVTVDARYLYPGSGVTLPNCPESGGTGWIVYKPKGSVASLVLSG